MPMSRTWEGLTLQARVHRAAGRAIVRVAERVAVNTKSVTHVQFGTLRRSIHAAPVGYDGGNDDRNAVGADLAASFFGQVEANDPFDTGEHAVEVGSWLPYACAEWIGRGHPGITEGLEMTRGAEVQSAVWMAFREEGL